MKLDEFKFPGYNSSHPGTEETEIVSLVQTNYSQLITHSVATTARSSSPAQSSRAGRLQL
jgi:hypothetical protein